MPKRKQKAARRVSEQPSDAVDALAERDEAVAGADDELVDSQGEEYGEEDSDDDGDDDGDDDDDSSSDELSDEENADDAEVDRLFAEGKLQLVDTGDDEDGDGVEPDGAGEGDADGGPDSPTLFTSRHEGRRSWPVDADFYSSDSDEELDGDTNTVGNVPLEWYQDYEHIGYNVFGKKLLKSEQTDSLDRMLSRADDPVYWNTVRDELNQRDVVLSSRDLDLLRAEQQGQFPMGYDPYEVWPETPGPPPGQLTALSGAPEPKRRFRPSKWEQDQVRRIVRGIARGVIKVPGEVEATSGQSAVAGGDPDESTGLAAPGRQGRPFYALWSEDAAGEGADQRFMHVPAPRLPLPGHAQSYNPPVEYLFSSEEEAAWKAQDPGDRELSFVPRQYTSLRAVPLYTQGMRERFERCLDLYLCPRTVKKRQNVDPKDLLPQLPKPHELRPFPVAEAVRFRGHTAPVCSVAIDPTGQWLCSGSEDGTARLWELATSRCLKIWDFAQQLQQRRRRQAANDEGDNEQEDHDGDNHNDDDDDDDDDSRLRRVHSVSWCPRADLPVVALAVGSALFFCNADVGSAEHREAAQILLQPAPVTAAKGGRRAASAAAAAKAGWSGGSAIGAALTRQGCLLMVDQGKTIEQVAWHRRGDYVASVAPLATGRAVLVHQLSSQTSQAPFKKVKGRVNSVAFHPIKPLFFVCTEHRVRVFDLLKQSLVKNLLPGCRQVAAISVHPGGDNVLVGSVDRRVCWFDLDYGSAPFRSLRPHRDPVRDVQFHRRLPLFASAADDAIQIFHGMVYSDLLSDPLIVPLKRLRGALAIDFHPQLPWLAAGMANGHIILYTS